MAPDPKPELLNLSEKLHAALQAVAKTKADAERAQATLDASREAWQGAVEAAKALHQQFQSAVVNFVPGTKLS